MNLIDTVAANIALAIHAGGPGSGRHRTATQFRKDQLKNYRKEQYNKSESDKPVNNKAHKWLAKGHEYLGNDEKGRSLYKAKVGNYTLAVEPNGKYYAIKARKFNPKLPDEERQTRVVDESSSEQPEDHFNHDFRGGGPGSGSKPSWSAKSLHPDKLDHMHNRLVEKGFSYKYSANDKDGKVHVYIKGDPTKAGRAIANIHENTDGKHSREIIKAAAFPRSKEARPQTLEDGFEDSVRAGGQDMTKEVPWIGVDFDGTLVVQKTFPRVGPPVEKMVALVKNWLTNGCKVKHIKGLVKCVKIFTARAKDPVQVKVVSDWTKKYLGKRLEVTNVKDSGCVRIVDNISVRVKQDKGTLEKPIFSENKTDGTVTRPNNDFRAGGPGSGRHPYAYTNSTEVMSHHGFEYRGRSADGKTSLYKGSGGTLASYNPGTNVWKHYEKDSVGRVKVYSGSGLGSLDSHMSRHYGETKFADTVYDPVPMYAGGPGSGRHPWGRKAKPAPKERVRGIPAPSLVKKVLSTKGWQVDSKKQAAANKNPIRIALAEQEVAEHIVEKMVAKGMGGKVYGNDSEPVDVVANDSKGKLHGIEVKCVMAKSANNARAQLGKSQSVYMGHGAVPLKQQWARDNKAGIHTVIADIREAIVKDKSGNLDIGKTVKNIEAGKVTVYHAPKVQAGLSFGNDATATAKSVDGGFKVQESALASSNFKAAAKSYNNSEETVCSIRYLSLHVRTVTGSGLMVLYPPVN